MDARSFGAQWDSYRWKWSEPSSSRCWVLNGQIVSIGATHEHGYREIDADGRLVTPGFIDIHTHYDAQAFWDPMLSPSSSHGVTSVIGGNCGFAIAPLDAMSAKYMLPLLARVEGMPIDSLTAGVPWNWTSTSDYLDRLEGGLAVNAGFFIGHSAVRRLVMGAAATTREARPEEAEAMCTLIREGLSAGAIGFSTAQSENHNDHEGNPVPSRWAADAEIVELARVCGEFSGTTMQMAGVWKGGGEVSEREINLMTKMSVEGKSPVLWNIVRVFANSVDYAAECIKQHERGLKNGANLITCLLPEPNLSRYSFKNGRQLDTLPGWAKPMALTADQKLALLSNPQERQRLKELAAQPTKRPERAAWSKYTVLETSAPENAKYVSRQIGEIAAELNKDPFDALIDIVVADKLQTVLTPMLIEESRADWETRARYCREESMVIGGSDAGAHVDARVTHNYPTRLLQKMVREHGVMSTEEVVHILTKVPADLFGITNRGRVASGAAADLLIIDEIRRIDSSSEQIREDWRKLR